jgi:hypothetical protein
MGKEQLNVRTCTRAQWLLTQNFYEIARASHGPTTSVQMTSPVQNLNYSHNKTPPQRYINNF